MQRNILIKIHLVLAALFMPLMLMMPLTGALYILGYQGDQTKTEAFKITDPVPEDKDQHEVFFREQFVKQSVDYKFEYIRSSKTEFTFRPTSKVYYIASVNEDKTLTVSKIDPNFLKRLIEIHKGHGPLLIKWFEVAFALGLICTVLSGIWLAWTVKAYRTITLISFGVGVSIIAICMI